MPAPSISANWPWMSGSMRGPAASVSTTRRACAGSAAAAPPRKPQARAQAATRALEGVDRFIRIRSDGVRECRRPSRQGTVAEVAEAHLAFARGEDREAQRQEAAEDVVMEAGDLALPAVLQPGAV